MDETNPDAYGDEANWTSDQSQWPEHLRDDAPTQTCGRCGRITAATEEFDTEDRMTQPDGYPCGGRFETESRQDTIVQQLANHAQVERLAVDPAGAGRHRLTATMRVSGGWTGPDRLMELVCWPAHARMTAVAVIRCEDGRAVSQAPVELVLRFVALPAGDLAEPPSAAGDLWMTRILPMSSE